jgi:hypothetical protein
MTHTLPSIKELHASRSGQLNRKPVSRRKNGTIKCSGKWSQEKINDIKNAGYVKVTA